MTGPFIIKTTSAIHPGKAEAYRPVAAEFCRLTEEAEPRLQCFQIFMSEDEGTEVVLQIHPDLESFRYHLDVMGAKVRETFAYTDWTSLEVFGEPDDALLQTLVQATDGIPFAVYPRHLGGFTRLR
jgi:hypothetical protein